MSNNVQGSNILDVLKKKMRATKEESEKSRKNVRIFRENYKWN